MEYMEGTSQNISAIYVMDSNGNSYGCPTSLQIQQTKNVMVRGKISVVSEKQTAWLQEIEKFVPDLQYTETNGKNV